jgi:hypothetical protein
MRFPLARLALVVIAAALLSPALAHAADVGALPPFPSNLQTVPDATQLTGLRVDLPMPNCTTNPSDCQDVAVLNRLDGFNVQPRISIPFSGAIDLGTVSSSTIFLRRVGCLVCAPVGINQVVWEPLTSTLHLESDRLLAQDATYLLVVTTGVHEVTGEPIESKSFLHDLNFGQTKDAATKAYRTQLKKTLQQTGDFGRVATASLFTTQSVTADLEQIRGQIDAATPAPAVVHHTVPRSAVSAILWSRQTTTAGPGAPAPVLGFFALDGAVGSLAFGSYASPNYETPAMEIPATPTKTGAPAVQGSNTLQFELFLPAGPKPAAGWPVALVGHGFTDSKQGAPFAVASSMAHAGIATIAINVVGHGGGPQGTLTLVTSGGPVVVPDGGRGIDQDGNGTIDSTEGVNTEPPDTLTGTRDSLRQTVVDLMQLVREIQVGIDVDGDGHADLDPTRMSYVGQSFGGIYGIDFLALEPDVPVGVANVPGGSIPEVARLGAFRPLVGLALLTRSPSLYNVPPNASLTNFVENEPLRNLPPLVDTVPDASAIQENLDRSEWAQQSANPAALAPYLRAEPLPGHPAKSVIVQFAKGDGTVPNPTTTALLRAGDLADRATYFRNDIAGPGMTPLYPNPHTFLTGIGNPATAPAAFAAQRQIATFLASGGTITIDPDGPGPVFETPIAGPLPEGTNFP